MERPKVKKEKADENSIDLTKDSDDEVSFDKLKIVSFNSSRRGSVMASSIKREDTSMEDCEQGRKDTEDRSRVRRLIDKAFDKIFISRIKLQCKSGFPASIQFLIEGTHANVQNCSRNEILLEAATLCFNSCVKEARYRLLNRIFLDTAAFVKTWNGVEGGMDAQLLQEELIAKKDHLYMDHYEANGGDEDYTPQTKLTADEFQVRVDEDLGNLRAQLDLFTQAEYSNAVMNSKRAKQDDDEREPVRLLNVPDTPENNRPPVPPMGKYVKRQVDWLEVEDIILGMAMGVCKTWPDIASCLPHREPLVVEARLARLRDDGVFKAPPDADIEYDEAYLKKVSVWLRKCCVRKEGYMEIVSLGGGDEDAPSDSGKRFRRFGGPGRKGSLGKGARKSKGTVKNRATVDETIRKKNEEADATNESISSGYATESKRKIKTRTSVKDNPDVKEEAVSDVKCKEKDSIKSEYNSDDEYESVDEASDCPSRDTHELSQREHILKPQTKSEETAYWARNPIPSGFADSFRPKQSSPLAREPSHKPNDPRQKGMDVFDGNAQRAPDDLKAGSESMGEFVQGVSPRGRSKRRRVDA